MADVENISCSVKCTSKTLMTGKWRAWNGAVHQPHPFWEWLHFDRQHWLPNFGLGLPDAVLRCWRIVISPCCPSCTIYKLDSKSYSVAVANVDFQYHKAIQKASPFFGEDQFTRPSFENHLHASHPLAVSPETELLKSCTICSAPIERHRGARRLQAQHSIHLLLQRVQYKHRLRLTMNDKVPATASVELRQKRVL